MFCCGKPMELVGFFISLDLQNSVEERRVNVTIRYYCCAVDPEHKKGVNHDNELLEFKCDATRIVITNTKKLYPWVPRVDEH